MTVEADGRIRGSRRQVGTRGTVPDGEVDRLQYVAACQMLRFGMGSLAYRLFLEELMRCVDTAVVRYGYTRDH